MQQTSKRLEQRIAEMEAEADPGARPDLAALPLPAVFCAGKFLGAVAYCLAVKYRRLVIRNLSVAFGDVAFGYRDGYWDNGHRWHRWNSNRDYQSYRNHHGNNYHDWNHDRDNDNGWQRR